MQNDTLPMHSVHGALHGAGGAFGPVSPVAAYGLVRYPTLDAFLADPDALVRHAPSQAWLRWMALASTVIGVSAGCTTSGPDDGGGGVFDPFGSGDDTGSSGGGTGGGTGGGDGGGTGGSGDDTGGIDTGGIDGDIGAEYWYYVSEEEAWTAISAWMDEQGYVPTGEVRAMTDRDGAATVDGVVFEGGDTGGEVILGPFESYAAMQTLWDAPTLSTDANSCVVVDTPDGCVEAWCGDDAALLPEDAETCAALGQLPYGEFYTWDPIDLEPAEIYGPAVSRFLEWAATQGLL